MKIDVQIVPREEIPYGNLDDYRYKNNVLTFKIADVVIPVYIRILLVHAIIEQLLSEVDGVSNEEIDNFDSSYKGNDEPGEEVNSPYRDPHSIAKGIEMVLCGYLKIPWKIYDDYVSQYGGG